VSTHGHRKDPHLDGLVAAVVDGALDHETRDRALAHLARCDECRGEVEAQRRLKAQLARLASPEVPGGLAERLLRLPDEVTGAHPPTARAALDRDLPPVRLAASFRDNPGGRPGRSRLGAATRRPGRSVPGAAVTHPAGSAPGPGRRASRRPSRLRVAGVAGGVAAFALSLATVLALGEPDAGRSVVPAVDSYLVEHTRTAVGVPGTDPAEQILDLIPVRTR
jgi:Putative zinc-finger